MQGGVERPLLTEQLALGRVGNPLRDRVTVPRSPAERLENEDVERPADDATFRIEQRAPL